MTKVFISHSSKDLGFAQDVVKPACDAAGLFGWLSESELNMGGGADFERELQRSLRTSDWFAVVMSPDAARSEWVKAETHWALENMIGRVIPLMFRPCEPASIHLRLGTLQYVDCSGALGRQCHALIERILAAEEALRTRTFSRPAEEDEKQTVVSLAPLRDCDATTLIPSTRCFQLSFSIEPPGCPAYDEHLRIGNSLVIGRGRGVDLQLNDDSVSRKHARINCLGGEGDAGLMITDLDSSNGTMLNGVRLTSPRQLCVRDLIELGETRLRLSAVAGI